MMEAKTKLARHIEVEHAYLRRSLEKRVHPDSKSTSAAYFAYWKIDLACKLRDFRYNLVHLWSCHSEVAISRDELLGRAVDLNLTGVPKKNRRQVLSGLDSILTHLIELRKEEDAKATRTLSDLSDVLKEFHQYK